MTEYKNECLFHRPNVLFEGPTLLPNCHGVILTMKNVKTDMKLLARIIAIKVKLSLQTFSLPSRYLPGEQLTK